MQKPSVQASSCQRQNVYKSAVKAKAYIRNHFQDSAVNNLPEMSARNLAGGIPAS